MENLFQQILAGCESRGVTTTFPHGTPLALNEVPDEHRLQDHQERRISQCEPELTQQLRELTEGKAPWPLFLHGPAGTGKTCAALSLLDYVAVKNSRAYREASMFVRHLTSLRYGSRRNTVQEAREWELIDACELSGMDELGTRNAVTDTHYEIVRSYIDFRGHRPTIYISNLDPKGIVATYDDRIASRLCSGTVFELGGKDRRLAAATQPATEGLNRT